MIDKPEKVYPCDCMGHGFVVTTYEGIDEDVLTVTRDLESEDEECSYFTVGIASWGHGFHDDGRYSWRHRLRHIWSIIRRGHPWLDQVDMSPVVAKKFAHHVLYCVEKMQHKMSHQQDEIKWPANEMIKEDRCPVCHSKPIGPDRETCVDCSH